MWLVLDSWKSSIESCQFQVHLLYFFQSWSSCYKGDVSQSGVIAGERRVLPADKDTLAVFGSSNEDGRGFFYVLRPGRYEVMYLLQLRGGRGEEGGERERGREGGREGERERGREGEREGEREVKRESHWDIILI